MATKPKVLINWPLARNVFGLMLEALRGKRWPYNVAENPHIEYNLPKRLSELGRDRKRVEARFFLVACYYMLAGIESDTAMRGLSKVFDQEPELFTADFSKLTGEERVYLRDRIFGILNQAGLNHRAGQVPDQMVYNFAKIDRFWGGDPRKLFAKTTKFDELQRRLIKKKRKFDPESPYGFLGFQEKMVSMLGFYLMDRRLMPYYLMPVPVDLHVLRILTATRVLHVDGAKDGDNLYTEEYREAARRVTYQYCSKYGVNWLRLCDCFWLLSRTGCRYHPDIRSKLGPPNGRKTQIFHTIYDWTERRTSTYAKTCGRCPISASCKYAVPSAYYYKQGKLRTRGVRSSPPNWQPEIDFPTGPARARSRGAKSKSNRSV